MEKDLSILLPGLGTFRFGSVAISRGYVTLEQVQRGLAEQVDDDFMGKPHRRLDEILREHNWITDEQMKSILEEMGVGDE